MVGGCYSHGVVVHSKHLWKYISEVSFRFNMRKEPAAMFSYLVLALAQPRFQEP